MKTILSLVLSLTSLLLFSQTEIYLTDPIAVAPDESIGYRAPRVSLLGDGTPVVYWGRPGATHRMYMARLEGGSFTSPLEINTNGIPVDLWSAGLGPQLASSENTIFLVFETYGEGIWCSRSVDGGQSFDQPVSVYELPPGRVATLPSVAVGADGNPVVSFVTTNQQEAEALYEVAVSLDGGLSFEPAVAANLASSEEVCECCPASLNIPDTDDLLLVYRNNDNNIRDIWASRSNDSGLSWPEATDLDDTDWETFVCPASGPHSLLVGDSLITVFYSFGEGTASVYFSTMGLTTMEKGQQVDLPTFTGEELSQNFPRIAGNQDTIGIVWEESAGNSKDIVFAFSDNGTSKLNTQLIKIADDLFASERYPDIAFSNGVFHIVYESPSTGNVMYRQARFTPLTGSSDLEKTGFQINALPNPFGNEFSVEIENPDRAAIDLSLFDVSGRLIWQRRINGSESNINGSEFLKGVYVLKAVAGNRVRALKLIKAK